MKTKTTYSIGQQFKLDGIGVYLLATSDGDTAQLIHINSGNRLANPIIVKDRLEITRAEFKLICQKRKFKTIKK